MSKRRKWIGPLTDEEWALWRLEGPDFREAAGAHIVAADKALGRNEVEISDERRAEVLVEARRLLKEQGKPVSEHALEMAVDNCLSDNRHLARARQLVEQIVPLWYEIRPSDEHGFTRGNLDAYFSKAAKVFSMYDEMVEEFKKSGIEVDIDPDIAQHMDLFRHAVSEGRSKAKEQLAQFDREERIQHRKQQRPPEVVMEGTKCSSCGKKPARVDDLCKVCAREAGVLPHGKIV